MDFSCYINLSNDLDVPLHLLSSGNSHGDWATRPPDEIPAKSSVSFRLKDNFGFYGAEGSFEYSANFPIVSETFSTSFGCPTGNNDNYVNNSLSVGTICRIDYQARSESSAWQENSVPTRGHPVYINYTFGYQTISTSSSVSAVYAKGDYSIVNAAGAVVDYSQPVWTPGGSYAEGEYSTRPAAFASRKTEVLTLTLQLDAAMANVPFRLIGSSSSGPLFESETVLGKAGQNQVAVTVGPPTTAPWQRYGDVRWVMVAQTSRQQLPLPQTTRLELYWLLNRPALMFARGTLVTLLRRILPVVKRDSSVESVAADVTSWCFAPEDTSIQKQYDSMTGGSHYVTNWAGGYFNVPKYFGGSREVANCYDQAAVAQVVMGALGVRGDWAYQQPYGFINTTQLLGRGACNNPFFLSNSSPQVVQQNEPNRTLFGNHAFVVLAGRVYDACQGPYKGTGDIAAYDAACIDATTKLYKGVQLPELRRPGNPNDVVSQPGVTSIEVVTAAADAIEHPNARLVWRMFTEARAAAAAGGGPERFFAAGAEAPFEQQLTPGGFEIAHRQDVLGHDGVLLLRTLASAGGSVDVGIWVSSAGTEEATRRLLEGMTTISLPLSAENVRPVGELGDSAVAIGAGNGHLRWVRHNVQVSLVADGELDLLPLAEALDAAIEAGAVEAGERRLPQLDLTLDAETVRVGEGVTVTVSTSGDAERLALDLSGDGRLELAAVRDGQHHFRAVEAGEAVVTFIALDPETLAVTTRSVSVVVQ